LLLLLLLLLHQLRKYRYTLKSHRLPLLVVIRSNYNIYAHTLDGRNIMDELVMMRSVGVGAGSAGASIISSVRSLPEKPRRTGKKNSFNYSLACAKFE
jgi:hypothetical protein